MSDGDCPHRRVAGNCPICRGIGATGTFPDGKIAVLREALEGLVDRLDEIHADPAYKSVWTIYHVHGGRYDGPTYVDALARAREALNR